MEKKNHTKEFTKKLAEEFVQLIDIYEEKNLKEDIITTYLNYRERTHDRYDMTTDRRLKKKYGWAILIILYIWLSLVILLLLLSSLSIISLSDTILATLLTTTTINILVLPAIVLKYLFSTNNKNKN